jgi:2-polyprenyl-3-methyl-5-hydroxy-6-metoxy-1,4-benzoquinol methylase
MILFATNFIKRIRFFRRAIPSFSSLAKLQLELEVVRNNSKQYGYYLARQQYQEIIKTPLIDSPQKIGLNSSACKQIDLHSDWFRYWCNELHLAPLFHRKLWEYAFILQYLHDQGMLTSGKQGVGFGCGEEPLASYLASHGVDCLVTDLSPTQVSGKGWVETGQYTSTLNAAYHEKLVDRHTFDQHVKHRFVDMNHIPSDLGQFDFAWSICAMEHIGSISQGLDFVKNSLKHVKSGGVVVHTTEFSYLRDDVTIESPDLVLFVKSHFESLFKALREEGHDVGIPNYDVGTMPLDMHIDLPPYSYVTNDHPWMNDQLRTYQDENPAHLKISVAGIPSTCFAIAIKKK